MGERRREKGDGRKEDGRRETGERRLKKGDRRKETGERRLETGGGSSVVEPEPVGVGPFSWSRSQ